ncbi:MAG: hypothetical protein ACO1OB_29555 [Archangium sp.]
MRLVTLLLLLASPTAEQRAIDESKARAGQFAFFGERCRGHLAGTWPKGTWVSQRSNDVCTHYFFFNREGAPVFDSACCEGTCQPELPKLGPATRDLCVEALGELKDGGVWLAASVEVTLREADGGVVPPLPSKVRRWPLHPGRFSASLHRSTLQFEVGTSGVKSLSDAGIDYDDAGFCMLGDLAFFPCRR